MSDSNRDDRDPETASGTTGGTGREDRAPAPSDDIDSGTGVGDRPGDRDPRDESTAVADEERRRKTSVISGIVAVLGLWVAASPLLFDVAEASLWNNLLVGAAVFLAAGYNVYRVSNDVPLSTGVASLIAVLGVWLIIAPALLEMTAGLFWSTLGSGLLIAGLAGYNAYDAREARQVATESTRA